jgi:cytochrome c-type biogenesis protein CcmH
VTAGPSALSKENIVKQFLFVALLVGALLGLAPAGAKEAAPVGADPAMQARMMSLASVLRCLVCQNQTIADSHADLAEDLRKQILEQMQAGKTDAEITDYMVARYGNFVLYRPPVKPTTVLLWFGPAALVLLGGLAFYRSARQRNRGNPQDEQLTPEQKALADRLLTQDEEGAA